MASSRLLQFRTKLAETSKMITENGGAFYKQFLEKYQHHVKDPPTRETCDKLSKQLFYTSIASVPHHYGLLKSEIAGVKQIVKTWRSLSVEHYGLATLLGLECYVWSQLGEFVGSGFTLTG